MVNWHPGPLGVQGIIDPFLYSYAKAAANALGEIEEGLKTGKLAVLQAVTTAPLSALLSALVFPLLSALLSSLLFSLLPSHLHFRSSQATPTDLAPPALPPFSTVDCEKEKTNPEFWFECGEGAAYADYSCGGGMHPNYAPGYNISEWYVPQTDKDHPFPKAESVVEYKQVKHGGGVMRDLHTDLLPHNETCLEHQDIGFAYVGKGLASFRLPAMKKGRLWACGFSMFANWENQWAGNKIFLGTTALPTLGAEAKWAGRDGVFGTCKRTRTYGRKYILASPRSAHAHSIFSLECRCRVSQGCRE
jgi:hypothetical protein